MKDPLLVEILKLPVSERILLVEEIWDSITREPDELELSPEQRADLDRRLAAYRADPKVGLTWEELKARVREP